MASDVILAAKATTIYYGSTIDTQAAEWAIAQRFFVSQRSLVKKVIFWTAEHMDKTCRVSIRQVDEDGMPTGAMLGYADVNLEDGVEISGNESFPCYQHEADFEDYLVCVVEAVGDVSRYAMVIVQESTGTQYKAWKNFRTNGWTSGSYPTGVPSLYQNGIFKSLDQGDTWSSGWSNSAINFQIHGDSDVGEGVAVPTVITNECTERTLVALVANGEITDIGEYICSRRGFCYLQGTEGDPNIDDDSEVHEDGEYDVGIYSLDIASLDSGLPYRVRAYATNLIGIGYGETVDSAVLSFPSDSMARVSSVRHICRPGLYRMEVALGDLGFDADVVEAAMRKATEGVTEPEEPLEEKPKVVLTPEDIEKAAERFREVSWPKAVESLELMFPERPPVSGKYTPPAPRPKITLTNPVTGEPLIPPTDKPIKKKYPFSYEALKIGLRDCQRWGGCKGMTVEQYAASLGVLVPPH